ncbi:twin-arginine translocation signal domain-containing protein [Halorussus sp. MSC15.2]|uniref:twin-arginine translocation signal domain-containing protein n=1 Tax=Halorussus sp. MSC15.2 TaxID=2283638 RepID=UPI0013CF8504|nr:twin-arginine translocation signal domain-containing protein [Halorussus sp. MSC15.2]NEU56985.1 hypothetical protein [Halorussus sp. MSC15.2]
MVLEPSRRSLLRSGLGLTAVCALAGCSSKLPGVQAESADEPPNVLERVRVANESDTDDLFNLSVVRNGEQVYFAQLDVPAGGSELVGAQWTEAGRTFVAVGESKSFCNHEVRALDADSQGSGQQAYEALFTVASSGDVTAGFQSV